MYARNMGELNNKTANNNFCDLGYSCLPMKLMKTVYYFVVMFLIGDSACTAGAVRRASQHGRLGFSHQHERLRSSSQVRTDPARFVPRVAINITKRFAPCLVRQSCTSIFYL